jgi:excisionase family DNA binding protein
MKTRVGADGAAAVPPDAERLLKAEEVGAILGLGRSKTYELIARRQLPVVHIGSAVRVPHRRLMRWIEEHTMEGHL